MSCEIISATVGLQQHLVWLQVNGAPEAGCYVCCLSGDGDQRDVESSNSRARHRTGGTIW